MRKKAIIDKITGLGYRMAYLFRIIEEKELNANKS
jgi:hypothetical protein